MATVTDRPASPSNIDPRVTHPLDVLRGTIRRYVVVEGLLSAAIFVTAWFALGLLLDFGVFKVATWDWVLDSPAWLRVAALVVAVLLLGAIVTLRIVGRLTKDLSYPALALVLERRFPKVLGDRLITAVELSDVERQSKYGYSSAMIRQTIDEARERVGTVPVNDVFNWRRLRRMAAVAVGLVVVVVAVGFASYAVGTQSANPYRFAWRFAHVTGTFLERNVLIQNSPWPRRAHLEFTNFDGDDRRIPKDAGDTTIRVKAYRWVVADRSAPMGWRPLRWNEVADVTGPTPELPEGAFKSAGLGDEPAAWSADEVQAAGLDDQEARTKVQAALPAEEYEQLRSKLQGVFAALDEKAASPSMGRRLRKLEVPEKVTLAYTGATKSGDVTLSPQKNNEFAGSITDLKESVKFVVRAEDFRTPERRVTLIPPPMLVKLTRTEYQPAYLHHFPPDGDYSALRGLRQTIVDKPVTLTGDRSPVMVPSGTELVLTATADTDLTAAYLQPKVGILPGAKPGSGDWVPLPIEDDRRTVKIEFRDDYRLAIGRTIDHYYIDDDGFTAVARMTITPTVEFDLVVEQADRVQSRRQFVVQVADDQPPTVEVAAETIRKVGNVYYVTPKARVPLNPESFIRDDHGLSKVAFEFNYWAEDSDIGRALRAQLLARSLLYPPGLPSVGGAVAPAFHAVKFKDLDKGDSRQTGSAEVGRFFELRKDFTFETRDRLAQLLAQPTEEGRQKMIQKVDLKPLEFFKDSEDRLVPQGDFFDVRSLKLLASVSEVQTRYRIDLNIVATDTNYDTGPKTGQNAEPIRLMVVSEGDLLAEINKEVDAFATRLDEGLSKLAGARKKWEVVRSLSATGRAANDRDTLDTVRVRATDADQDVGKCQDVVQSVVRDYRRLHKECFVNDVTEVTRDSFGKFANRMDRILGENPPAVTKEEAAEVQVGRGLPRMTFTETDRRIEAVLSAVNAGQWAEPVPIVDAENALMLLEAELKTIRAELGELQSKERIKKYLEDIIKKQEAISKELNEWKIRAEEDALRPEPKLASIGPQFFTKGEAKKLKHEIKWRQYLKDELGVKVSVTDKEGKPVAADALIVPAQLKLNFEANQFDFEYEVKAGAKEGEYTVTLTPEVGDPVKVVVAVK